MTATEEQLDPTNPEHLRRARILAETMMARIGIRFSETWLKIFQRAATTQALCSQT